MLEEILSGEGADELFAGYSNLKSTPLGRLREEQIAAPQALHTIASLRLDRMNRCHSPRVVTPVVSLRLLRYARALPDSFLIHNEGGEKVEKWILRKAFSGRLDLSFDRACFHDRRTKGALPPGAASDALDSLPI